MNEQYDRLFPLEGAFSEREYLVFLSQRVPKDLGDQLTRDAHPDLMIDKYVELADLLRPLSTYSFPEDCDSCSDAVFRLAGILEYALSGYALRIRKGRGGSHDPFKEIYVVSLFLYCCMHGAMKASMYPSALLVLVAATARVDMGSRFQVCGFLASLVPLVTRKRIHDPAPRSCGLIGFALTVGMILCDLMAVAEREIQEEDFVPAWQEYERNWQGSVSLTAMQLFRSSLAEQFGASGTLSELGDRLRRAADFSPKSGETG